MKKLYLILIGFFVCMAITSQHAMEVEQPMSKNALPQSNGLRSSAVSMRRLMNWNEYMEDETTQQTARVVPQASSTSSTGTSIAQSTQSQPNNPVTSNTQNTELFWQALQPQSETLKSALILLSKGAQPNLKTISAEEANKKIYPLVVYLIEHAHKKNEYDPLDLLKKLIAFGLKVNAHPDKEISLLEQAISRSFKYTQNITIKALIKELIATGADITTLVQSQDKQTFEVLLACGADATKMFNIFAAIQTERPENLFKLLLNAGASVIEFVKQNNVDSMRWLIEHGALLNHPSNILLLHTAAAKNAHKMVDLLLKHKINLAYADPNNQDATAIQIPLCDGRVTMVEKLLNAGVPPYKKGSPEEQLMCAVEKNDTQAVIALLAGSGMQRKANPNLITHESQHILAVAVKNQNREIAGELMQHGCKLNYIIAQGNVSAIKALLEIQQEQPVNLIKQATELLGFTLERQKQNWYELVITLLEQNAPFELLLQDNDEFIEPLKSNPTLLEQLIKAQANKTVLPRRLTMLENPNTIAKITTIHPQIVGYKDIQGNTLLHYAAQRNSITTAKTDKETPQQQLQLAADTEQTIKNLVKAGADINAQNKNGETPLMLAALYNNFIAIKTLVVWGANPTIATKEKKTPRTIAALYKEEEVVKELEAEVKTSTSSENCNCIARRTE